MNRIHRLLVILVVFFCAACVTIQPYESSIDAESAKALIKRDFTPQIDDKWIGNGISYSAYRDGEGPDKGSLTSKEDILEDLRLISSRWNLIRMYSAAKQSQNVLEVIRDHDLPIRVMQGAWISNHNTTQQNRSEIDDLIRLANEFSSIIIAVNVGNEIFVDWSSHRVDDMDQVISYIREVRAGISQPVTVNDDYNFWNKPQAKKIADEIDFIGLHAYAFWNNKTIDEAMDWTESTYRDIQNEHPDHLIAYTETGWPTSRIFDDSYEGKLIGKAGESQQEKFFDEYNNWVEAKGIISLYFAAFDEQWKGGFDGENPNDKAEKHWGVYRSDRTPKALLK